MNGTHEIVGLVDSTGNVVSFEPGEECLFLLCLESWKTTDSNTIYHAPIVGSHYDTEENATALLNSIPEDAVVKVLVNFDKIKDYGHVKHHHLESLPTVVTDDEALNALAAQRHVRFERQLEGIGTAAYNYRLKQWECKIPKRRGARLLLHCLIDAFDTLSTKAISTHSHLDDLLDRSVEAITKNLGDWVDSETDDPTDIHTLDWLRKSLRLCNCDIFADGRVSLSFSGDKTLLRNHRVKADWTPDLKDCNVLLYG